MPKNKLNKGRKMEASLPVHRTALNLEEAAESLGLSRTTLYQLLKAGQGPSLIKIGRRRLVSIQALHDWLQQEQVGGVER